MQLPDTTYEILACRVLNRSFGEEWQTWAIEMLRQDTTLNICILAGEGPPYNQFYMQELVDKVLVELDLVPTDKRKTLMDHVRYLVKSTVHNGADKRATLRTLQELYYELNLDHELSNFAQLSWALDDLEYAEEQWYWPGANRNNIDQVITDYLIKWDAENRLEP